MCLATAILSESVRDASPFAAAVACGSCRICGRTERAHRSLQNHRTVLHKLPHASSSYLFQEERQIRTSQSAGAATHRFCGGGLRRQHPPAQRHGAGVFPVRRSRMDATTLERSTPRVVRQPIGVGKPLCRSAMSHASHRAVATAIIACVAWCLVSPTAAQQPTSTFIRGASIIDGSGSSPRVEDVRIVGDCIVELGRLNAASSDVVIEAQGLSTSPRFHRQP